VSELVSVEDPPVRPASGWWRTTWRIRGDERSAILSREILLVLGMSLGASAVYSVMSLISKLTAPAPLSQQTTTLNTSPAPGRPLLALFLELFDLLFSYVVPALLALYLLNRDRDWSPTTQRAGTRLGLDRQRWRFDTATGLGLAAVIGIPGLGLYVAARALGINTDVAAANLTEWWAGPVLVLLAFGNGLLEEVVVVGYLVTRLRQTGWGVAAAVTFSAVLRGTYHLYQGFGAFVGNAIMGVVFTLFYLRFRRLWPLVIAHTILDVIAFLGYTLLHNHLSWL
jgi:membrane protease YdiL (CAAX protease family)